MKPAVELLWKDRKRYLGMPLSFTKYSMSADRLFFEKGLLSVTFEEIVLYRITDISLKVNLWQRIFGVGTVLVHSSDKTTPHFEIKNIKNPMVVKEMIHKQVEEMKLSRRVRVNELLDADDFGDDDCCDEE